ncbi:DUF4142 domain-containing protein [Hymenobacter artigasi]|uniref:Membrane protein n=1 Tax=Hymenobacter artigasi TaxID=2719616 RepID=A0ABX1HN52_9BACT|nr:DUF4142 domain-containing protein [Hymenobacter artigasi]NKI91689.1 putative membrane protein [Hymenobacter artigasi]
MKNRLNALLLFLIASGLSACTGSQDAVQQANQANERRNETVAAAIETPEQIKKKLDYDAGFAVAASSSNQLEVAISKLAQQKAIALEVKEWAKTIETEHTKMDQELEAIAGRANITLPRMMSDDDRDHYNDVDDRKYFGFDKKYLRSLKDAHERDVQRYAAAATQLSNAELRAFAAQALPNLRAHLQQTEELYKRADERK